MREKLRFLGDIFSGLIFPKRQLHELGLDELDLSRVPEKKLVQKLTSMVRKKYPSVYDVLIDERNKIMANNLAGLLRTFPDSKIVAVVGAGHEEEILKLVNEKLYKSSS